MDTNWEKKIRENLSQLHCGIHPEETVLQLKHKKKKKDSSFGFSIFLIFIAVGFSLLNIILINQKQVEKVGPRVIMAGEISSKPSGDVDKISEKVNKLSDKQDIHADKIFLLGVINNENMALLQKRDPENASKYLYLEKDWHLNKSPEHLQFDDAGKKVLEKYLPAKK